MEPSASVALVGAGSAAWALGRAFTAAGAQLTVWARDAPRARELARALGKQARAVGEPGGLAGARDLVLAVSDRAIGEVAELAARRLEPFPGAALHTSGAQGPEALGPLADAGWRVGVLHPLLALRRTTRPERLRGAAFALAGSPAARERARALALCVGGFELAIDDEEEARLRYHAAATLLASGAAALFAAAEEELVQAGAPASDARAGLAKLLDSVRANVAELGPVDGLTGPIARGDRAVVARHQDVLAGEAYALYRALAGPIERLALRGGGGESG